MGTGSLSIGTDTIFMPAPQGDRSFYYFVLLLILLLYLLVCLPFYCVGLSLDCLFVFKYNTIVGGGMCHAGGMCICYMLGIYLV